MPSASSPRSPCPRLYYVISGAGGASAGLDSIMVRHARIIRGHREGSSLPRLRLIPTGIRRGRANSGPPTSPPRLPITALLLRPHCLSVTPSHDELLLWVTCFFGFFRAGEITVPSVARPFTLPGGMSRTVVWSASI